MSLTDVTQAPHLMRLGDLLTEWETDAIAAHEACVNGTPRGPVTGLPTVDRELGGSLPPGLHIVHGQPGSGKTAFALQIAASCECPSLFISCEMSPLELLRRITARATNTFLGRLRTGELLPAESLSLAQRAAAACSHVVLADATQVFATPDWILKAALATRGDSRYLLIVLDSIHSWAEGASGDMQEYEALNAALAALRKVAGTLDCPVLGVAERNRASMRSGGLSAGAGTRKIEYGATTVLDLERDLDTRPDAAGEVPVGVRFAKNRNGAAGRKVDLLFHGALQRFREAGR